MPEESPYTVSHSCRWTRNNKQSGFYPGNASQAGWWQGHRPFQDQWRCLTAPGWPDWRLSVWSVRFLIRKC